MAAKRLPNGLGDVGVNDGGSGGGLRDLVGFGDATDLLGNKEEMLGMAFEQPFWFPNRLDKL